MDTRSEIRDFLTSRRGRITPEEVGLPVYGSRRVPGLRRQEVATLAGLSIDYYNRMERGNLGGASDGVLEALSRALRLDEAERVHLFDRARSSRASGDRPRRSASTPRRQLPRASFLLGPVRWRRSGQLGALHLPRPSGQGLLRRMGARREGLCRPCFAPRRGAARTIESSRAWSGSSPPRARSSAATGQPTTSASTTKGSQALQPSRGRRAGAEL